VPVRSEIPDGRPPWGRFSQGDASDICAMRPTTRHRGGGSIPWLPLDDERERSHDLAPSWVHPPGVPAPFADVAVHVVEVPFVGHSFPDLMRLPVAVAPVPKLIGCNGETAVCIFAPQAVLDAAHAERFVRHPPLPGEVWINPPADQPDPRMLPLPRDTNLEQQLPQTG
jgi:hypothetical protein